ncbi:hypothetical protein CYLTODRAFT_450928 [Cylindrobasidium torrendii FP15055 ss-10]|uniref:F-box domain-containing protein n=1 Tax=Cylindrobasidium torrendii FP15055 ss-10 TaxID=1314674 RepID=A0A0D7BMA5_9AGAR|nr:hypothetical protein CYLTODRAFT_450928 [Cylindrobasidium torrendii FP15055 ss-10]
MSSTTTLTSASAEFPVEILSTIFEFFVHGDDLDTASVFELGGPQLPHQFLLMAICRKWKSICISLPTLWSNITMRAIPKNLHLLPDSPKWNLFVQACDNALGWGKSLPLKLKIVDWPNEDSLYRINRHVEVTDHLSLANRVLLLTVDRCERWQTFTMCGWSSSWPGQRSAYIPLRALLDVKGRIPQLQAFAFSCLFWDSKLPPLPRVLPAGCTNIFLSAPRLSSATLDAGVTPFNLPWAQLKEIALDADLGFGTYQHFTTYFNTVMGQTKASSVCWNTDQSYLFINHAGVNIHGTPPGVRNHHVVDFRIKGLTFPPLLLPKLTSLRFMVTDPDRASILGSVPFVLPLLGNSGCRLVNLTVDQLSGRNISNITSISPLFPYLEHLRTLVWNTSLLTEIVLDDLIYSLHDILTSTPTKLPTLSTLELNIKESHFGSAQSFYFDHLHAEAVWDMAQARMIGQGHDGLAKFYINVHPWPNQTEPMKVVVGPFKDSRAGKDILAAGVDFRFNGKRLDHEDWGTEGSWIIDG